MNLSFSIFTVYPIKHILAIGGEIWYNKAMEMNTQGTTIIGMSGGVDSSVAALLLKRQGKTSWRFHEELGGGRKAAYAQLHRIFPMFAKPQRL